MKLLLDAVKFRELTKLSSTAKLQNKFEVEVENNGMYKLLDNGYIVAPLMAWMNCAGLFYCDNIFINL
ncbi:MAG: hypothetical protein ABJB11_23950 [Ferruginibacter sp.]